MDNEEMFVNKLTYFAVSLISAIGWSNLRTSKSLCIEWPMSIRPLTIDATSCTTKSTDGAEKAKTKINYQIFEMRKDFEEHKMT